MSTDCLDVLARADPPITSFNYWAFISIATMTRTPSSCTRRWRRIACLDGSSADRRATAPCPTGSIPCSGSRQLPSSISATTS